MRATTGPTARTGAAMAFVSGPPARVILFGGKSGSTYLNDTWSWDGVTGTWRPLTTPMSPPARSGHAMVGIAGNVYIFGGITSSDGGATAYLGDSWQLTVTGPSPAWAVAAESAALPAARSGHSMVANPRLSAGVVLFGGESASGFTADTWARTTVSWMDVTASSTMRPSARFGHAVASDTGRGAIFLFGGQAMQGVVASVAGDTWIYDGTSQWSPVTPAAGVAPPPVYNAAMVFDSRAGRALLFGGRVAAGQAVGTTWELSGGNTWIQRHPTTSPPARAEHAMAYDAASDHVVLFGGGSDTDTWEWTGAP
jgi:hypothetical protein